MPTDPFSDLRTLLSWEALAAARGANNDDRANAFFTPAFQRPYPPHWPLFQAYQNLAYFPSPLPARDREMIILATLLPLGVTGSALGAHVYMGLAAGAELDPMMACFLYVGEYAGVVRYLAATGVTRQVLTLLQSRYDQKLSMTDTDVLGAILATVK